MPFKQFRPASQALHNSLAMRPLERKVLDVVGSEDDILVSLVWDAAGEVSHFSFFDKQDFISVNCFLSTITNKEGWLPLESLSVPYQHLVKDLEGWLLLRFFLFLPDGIMLLEKFDFVLCRFSKFRVNADTQVKGLVGHEILVLDFVLVSECQRIFAFVLVDKFAYDCQLSVLVSLSWKT